GASGLGKTSLLRAGLFPAIRDELFPIVVRLQLADGGQPIFASLPADIAAQAKQHRVDVEAPVESKAVPLHELVREMFFWSSQDRLLVTLLVIDNLEALFMLGRGRRGNVVREIVDELAPLAHPREHFPRSEPAERTETVAPRPRLLLSLREDFLADLE